MRKYCDKLIELKRKDLADKVEGIGKPLMDPFKF